MCFLCNQIYVIVMLLSVRRYWQRSCMAFCMILPLSKCRSRETQFCLTSKLEGRKGFKVIDLLCFTLSEVSRTAWTCARALRLNCWPRPKGWPVRSFDLKQILVDWRMSIVSLEQKGRHSKVPSVPYQTRSVK